MLFRTGLAFIFVAVFATASSGQVRATPDAAACAAAAGHIEKLGRTHGSYCVKPFSDAGRECRNKSDCKGQCVAPITPHQGAKAAGRCQADDAPLYGCHAIVDHGKVVSALCID
jgi:hypothetical protein